MNTDSSCVAIYVGRILPHAIIENVWKKCAIIRNLNHEKNVWFRTQTQHVRKFCFRYLICE